MKHPERLFILVVGSLWLSLVLIDRLAPLVLPPDMLYFRAWEYVRGQHGYPRKNLTVTIENAHGDLSNMMGVSGYKAKRRVQFTVDENGMRNPTDSTVNGSVFLVGQSFVAGAGNTNTASPRTALEKALERPVYAFAPANMSQLLQELPAIEKPSAVVWGMVERNMHGGNAEIRTLIRMECPNEIHKKTALITVKDFVKPILLEPTTYARLSVVKKFAQRIYNETYFAVREVPASPHVTLAEKPSLFIFLTKGVHMATYSSQKRNIDIVQEAIRKTQRCLAQQDITLILLPIPDKVHIYNDLLPSNLQSNLSENPLLELVETLRKEDIHVVDIISPFTEYAATHSDLLYWPDDTHWNPIGISTAMQTVAMYLMKNVEFPHRKVPKQHQDLGNHLGNNLIHSSYINKKIQDKPRPQEPSNRDGKHHK